MIGLSAPEHIMSKTSDGERRLEPERGSRNRQHSGTAEECKTSSIANALSPGLNRNTLTLRPTVPFGADREHGASAGLRRNYDISKCGPGRVGVSISKVDSLMWDLPFTLHLAHSRLEVSKQNSARPSFLPFSHSNLECDMDDFMACSE